MNAILVAPKKSSKDEDDNEPKNPRGLGTRKEALVGMVERGGKSNKRY